MATTIRVTFEVNYNLNGESVKTISDHLEQFALNAIGNGLLTGTTAAEVEAYHIKVTAVPEAIPSEAITEYMRPG